MREALTLNTGSWRSRGFRRAGVALLLLAIGIVSAGSVSCVRTGHVGVVTLFGRVTGRTMPEGIHVVHPLTRVHELDGAVAQSEHQGGRRREPEVRVAIDLRR